jgi:hypothetical protein
MTSLWVNVNIKVPLVASAWTRLPTSILPSGHDAIERGDDLLVETAARMFREKGFDGVGVDAIMKSAGLTHGASTVISDQRTNLPPKR